jgi:hypothetical protein
MISALMKNLLLEWPATEPSRSNEETRHDRANPRRTISGANPILSLGDPRAGAFARAGERLQRGSDGGALQRRHAATRVKEIGAPSGRRPNWGKFENEKPAAVSGPRAYSLARMQLCR